MLEDARQGGLKEFQKQEPATPEEYREYLQLLTQLERQLRREGAASAPSELHSRELRLKGGVGSLLLRSFGTMIFSSAERVRYRTYVRYRSRNPFNLLVESKKSKIK
jgi:hypothetical protein